MIKISPTLTSEFAMGQVAGVMFGMRTGGTRYYLANNVGFRGALPNYAVSGNILRAFPFLPPRNITIDKLGVYVTSYVSGAKMRIGIYSDDGNLFPKNRLVQSPEINCGSNGLKEGTIEQNLLATKLYWVIALGSSNPTIRCVTDGILAILGWDNTMPTAGDVGWQKSFTYAELPLVFPTDATPLSASSYTSLPALFLRIK